MKKDEFLRRLNAALSPLQKPERVKTVQYYRECVEDRMEDGMDEETAVGGLEPIDTIAARAIEDAQSRGMLRKKPHPLSTILIVLGFPVWFSLLAALGAVTLAMYVSAWAVIVSLFAVVASLGLAGVAGVAAVALYYAAHLWTAVFLLGAGCVCAALGIVLFFPSLALTKWLIAGTGRVARALWSWVVRRKGGAQ